MALDINKENGAGQTAPQINLGAAFSDFMAKRLQEISDNSNFPTAEEIAAANGDLTLALTSKLAIVSALSEPPSPIDAILFAIETSAY
jgi:hypothetical protein